MRVVALPEVRTYLKKLSHLLYLNDYFGYEESALKYVDDLFYDISTTLPDRQKKFATSHFDCYGKNMYYATFRKSKATQWFVFFTIY